MKRRTLTQKLNDLKMKYHDSLLLESGELRLEGFRPENIATLVNEGVLERVRHGLYRFSDAEEPDDEQLIASLYPEGVICAYSALFHYGYSDRVPSSWDVAIDRNVSKARFNVDHLTVNPHYMDAKHLEYGVTRDDFNGTDLGVFDRDRLICEVVRNERTMDAELFRKAIQRYVSDPRQNVSQLVKYAKKRNMMKRVEDRVGVWLV